MKSMRFLLTRLVAPLVCFVLVFGSALRLEATTTANGGIDLDPVSYSLVKNFTTEFCEAIDDGVSVSSAYDIAVPAALWKSAGSFLSYTLSSLGQEESENQVEEWGPQLQALVLKKTQKCLTTAQSDELRQVLIEKGNAEEAG